MSNGCWTSVRSFCGSSLYLARVARRANSLPPNHTATLRPLRSAGVLMPDVLKASCRMPLWAKIWPMLTSGTPCSREESRLGSQSIPNSAPRPATTCSGTMSGPPGTMVTSRFSAL